MSKDRRTSGVEPVSNGQVDVLVSATKRYPGGEEKFELAKGHPHLRKRLWRLLDQLWEEQKVRMDIITRPIWRTIRLDDNLRSAEDFLEALRKLGKVRMVEEYERADFRTKRLFDAALAQADYSTEIDLVIVSYDELSFPNHGAFHGELLGKAVKFLKLSLVPPWVALQLYLQYERGDKFEEKSLRLGMEPIKVNPELPEHDTPYTLVVDTGYGRRNWSVPGPSGVEFDTGDPGLYLPNNSELRWLFARRK